MYYKFIDEFNIIEAPKSIIIDGKTILNFNKSINYMLKYGYKPLVNSGVLDYNPMYQEKVYMYVNKPVKARDDPPELETVHQEQGQRDPVPDDLL